MASSNDLLRQINPTSCLPRIKDEPALTDLFQALAHLANLYSPQSLTSEEVALYAQDGPSNLIRNGGEEVAYQDAIDSAKVDDNEKRYAMNWLTRLIGSGLYWIDEETDDLSADTLVDLAGRILGGHAAMEEAGAISREFVFPLKDPVIIPETDALAHPVLHSPCTIEVTLRDDPLPPSDKQSEANTQDGNTGSSQDAAAAVGVQTWGASIVVSDVLVRHPSLFHLALGGKDVKGFRVAELGAGTGLLGMVAVKLLQQQDLQADVVLTDYHSQVLKNLEHNVKENFAGQASDQVSVTVEHLDWLEVHQKMLIGESNSAEDEQSKFDLLLLADVIYAPEHALWIRSSIETLLRKPTLEDAKGNTARAHLIMAVRGSGKFEGLFTTVEEAFKPRSRSQSPSAPSLSASNSITPLDTLPGTPAVHAEPVATEALKSHSKHSDLLRSRMDALSLQDASKEEALPAELAILKRRRLDKRSSVGRNDEQEYLWFEIGWCH